MLKPSFNILRDRKLAMCAQACVDSALWDAVGKALDVPLYKLWGGYTGRLPSICIAGYYEEGKTLADFGREMEQIKADGHAGCKFKVGGRTPKEDAERVRTARSAAGDDFILIVDANQGWCAGTTTASISPRRATRPASRSAPARARLAAPAAAT
jgi:D-arabinonate dehydratase